MAELWRKQLNNEMTREVHRLGLRVRHGRVRMPSWDKMEITVKWGDGRPRTMTMAKYMKAIKDSDERGRKAHPLRVWSERDEMLYQKHHSAR